MKYADGPVAQAAVEVAAGIGTVWDLVTDINLPAGYSSEFRGATWLDDGPRLGARFRGRNRHEALGEWETTSVITSFEPPRRFGWDVGDPDHPAASWRFELEEDGGRTQVRYWARLGPAPSGLTVAITAMPDKEERIIARRLAELEANMTATLAGIKELAEARDQGNAADGGAREPGAAG